MNLSKTIELFGTKWTLIYASLNKYHFGYQELLGWNKNVTNKWLYHKYVGNKKKKNSHWKGWGGGEVLAKISLELIGNGKIKGKDKCTKHWTLSW